MINSVSNPQCRGVATNRLATVITGYGRGSIPCRDEKFFDFLKPFFLKEPLEIRRHSKEVKTLSIVFYYGPVSFRPVFPLVGDFDFSV